MLFIYWGWDTAVSVNEETKDKTKTPGRAAIISTVILLVTYAIIIFGIQAFAGIGSKGIGLSNLEHAFDVLSVLARRLRARRVRHVPVPAAHPDGADLGLCLDPDDDPADRPHHPVDGRLQGHPRVLRQDPPRYLTPTVSTIVMGVVSIILYIPFNYFAGGNPIGDAVTAIGLYIAFYYGLTAFSCVWYYRNTLTSSAATCGCRASCPAGRPDHVRRGHLQPAERLGGEQ